MDIHDIFINFQARVANDVRKKIIGGNTFYTNNVVRKPWLDNQGRTFTYPTFDRAGIAGSFAPFTAIPAYAAGSIGQVPTVEAGVFAATIREVTLHQTATNSPTINVRDLQFDYQIEQQLSISVDNLAEGTKFTWEQELANRYIEIAGNKLVYTNDVPTLSTWGATVPTNPLDWAVLDYVYSKLRYIASSEDVGGTDEDGKVVLIAVGSYDVFNNLKLQDSNFRADVRAINTGGKDMSALVGSPGLSKGTVYRGWKFETIQFAPHYDFVDGAWVQRFPWKLESKSNGLGLEIDALYEDANYTDVSVFSNKGFYHLVPAPKGEPHVHNPDVDWAGNYKWKKLPLNIDATNDYYNPDELLGIWRTVYAYGPQVQRPDLAYVIRVQRCKPTFGAITCSVPGSA